MKQEDLKKKNGKKKRKQKKKASHVFLNVLMGAVFFLGLAILNYPTLSNLYNQYNQTRLISNYEGTVEGLDKETLKKLWDEAESYNERLAGQRKIIYKDIFSSNEMEESKEYSELLNVSEDGMMGSIEIPKIHVYLSIGHGLSEEVLRKGVGHMTGSSLPVGGTTSHCILAGHRGLPGAELFTDLDQLELGDAFYIHVLDRTLKYEVDDIKVVLPEEVNQFALENGKDYVTLITCTPYGINSHRLLIRGIRVPYDDTQDQSTGSPEQSMLDWLLSQKILFISALVIVILLAVIILKGKRKKN